jgi:hypothetical protein
MRKMKQQKTKNRYELQQTFEIIIHAFHDIFLPFLIVTFVRIMSIQTRYNNSFEISFLPHLRLS